MTVVTVAKRRAAEIARLAASLAAATAELAAYARSHGVRFVVFGSFARGDFVATSDLDLMIDGPEKHLRAARAFAEEVCERNGLSHDIYLSSEVSESLMSRIRRDGGTVS